MADELDVLGIIEVSYREDESVEALDKKEEYFIEMRRKTLEELGKTEAEINEDLEEQRRKINEADKKKQFDAEKKRLEDLSKYAATLEERNDAKRQKLRMEQAEQLSEATAGAMKGAINAFNGTYEKITKSAQFYGDLLGKMETRLLGSGKTYSSVADMVSKAFAVSPFFSMENVMKKTSEFVEKGIAYNVELRASMATLSDKIANTFDALDATLLRTVRMQQQDSTQARLGMENALNKFLNSQYKDTSYLNGLSDQVSAALIEATATMTLNANQSTSKEDNGMKTSTAFEYAVQKVLGSMYSVGVSDNLIMSLATGLGYLGSGNVTGLNSNNALETLLVSAANRSEGTSYGDMLINGMKTSDVTGILMGLHDLVSEISQSGNVVAMQQYAEVFGMTMSDLTSILNLTSKDIQTISSDLLTYDDMVTNLNNELSFTNLYRRSSGTEIIDNLLGNFIGNAGKNMGTSPASYFAWQLAGMVNEFLDGIDTGIDFQPWGMGGHLNLSIGDITKAVTVAGGLASGLPSVLSGLSSIGGVNLNALENAERVSRGDVSKLSSLTEGRHESAKEGVVDTNEDSMLKTADQQADQQANKVVDEDLDEQKKQLEEQQKALERIDDNVSFIVQMLNTTGIVIRGRAGETVEDIFSGTTDVLSFINR